MVGVPFILVTTSINLFSFINYLFFYKAAQEGHIDAITFLLNKNCNINSRTNRGGTALSIGIVLISDWTKLNIKLNMF